MNNYNKFYKNIIQEIKYNIIENMYNEKKKQNNILYTLELNKMLIVFTIPYNDLKYLYKLSKNKDIEKQTKYFYCIYKNIYNYLIKNYKKLDNLNNDKLLYNILILFIISYNTNNNDFKIIINNIFNILDNTDEGLRIQQEYIKRLMIINEKLKIIN